MKRKVKCQHSDDISECPPCWAEFRGEQPDADAGNDPTLLIDPSAFEFFLESIYGKRPENKKAAYILRNSFRTEHLRLRKEDLRIIHRTIVNNDVAGPVKWQVEDMQAALEAEIKRPAPGREGEE